MDTIMLDNMPDATERDVSQDWKRPCMELEPLYVMLAILAETPFM